MVEEVVELPLEEIEEDGVYRFRLWLDVRDLVEDIRVHGQDFPVVVRPRGDRYQLVCGYRRVTAPRQLGATTVKAVVRKLATLDAVLQEGVQRGQITTEHAITLNVLKETVPDLDFARSTSWAICRCDGGRRRRARPLPSGCWRPRGGFGAAGDVHFPVRKTALGR